MESTSKKYKLTELSLGMKIKDKAQLSELYDTWIILTRQSPNEPYTIEFIGKETNSESDKLFKQGKQVCPVYNDSIELEGDIFDEE